MQPDIHDQSQLRNQQKIHNSQDIPELTIVALIRRYGRKVIIVLIPFDEGNIGYKLLIATLHKLRLNNGLLEHYQLNKYISANEATVSIKERVL